jgi:LDH2 family malate/lactate/ureidoglycolate dehydrogenase
MRVSVNELETRYARALEGLGLPGGLARDAARMVARHDVWGLDGLGRLAGRLDRLDGANLPALAPRPSDDGYTLDAQSASLLAVGPTAVDLLDALAAGDAGGGTVRVTGCADADFAAGLAALAAERDLTVVVRTVLDGETLQAAACSGEVAVDRRPATAGDPAPGTVTLAGGRTLTPAGADAPEPTQRISGNRIAGREQDALDAGVAVDADAWQRIYELGARFLVAESETSRTTGAGGADT